MKKENRFLSSNKDLQKEISWYNEGTHWLSSEKYRSYFFSFFKNMAFTDMVEGLGTGTLTDSTTILNGSTGRILIGIMALSLITYVVGKVKRWW